MKRLIVCWLLLFHISGKAQHYFETYTPANGLVDARVNNIIQDKTGRLFFLTREGVSIFDGQRFINHSTISGKTIGIVECATVLLNGTVQLYTFNGLCINFKKNATEPDTAILKGISEASSVAPIANDEWLISSNKGIYLKKQATHTPIYLAKKDEIIDQAVAVGNVILFSSSKSGSKNYLYACTKTNSKLTDSFLLGNAEPFFKNTDKGVYLIINNVVGQIDLKELEKGKIKISKFQMPRTVPANFMVQRIFIDRQKNTWLLNLEKGCYKINPTTGETIHYNSENGLLQGGSQIFQDNENNIWFLALSKGVQKLQQTQLEQLTHIDGNAISYVHFIAQTLGNNFLIRTTEKVFVFKNGKPKPYPASLVAGLTRFSYWKNKFWNYFPPTLLRANDGETISITPANIAHKPDDMISAIVDVDRTGNLIFAGNYFTLVQQNHNAQSFTLPYFADNIVHDEAGNYWVFCRNDYALKFSLTNGKIKKEAELPTPDFTTRFVMHWRLDTFWVATRNRGILIVKVKDNKQQIIGTISKQHGLSNNFVEALTKIDEHRIAVGTAAGLDIVHINGKDTVAENISARINNFEPIIRLLRDGDRAVYALTETGKLLRYNPNMEFDNKFIPSLILNSSINGNSIKEPTGRFAYNKNNFKFSASSPSFIDNRNTNFEYTLKGSQNVWEQVGKNADFSINNLLPGSYTLKLQVRYPGNIYPDKQLQYQFVIASPFWKTWWFIVAVVLLFLILILFFIRSFLRRQLEKHKVIMEKELAIEQERTRVARDLHDGLGSMLSGIKHSFSAMKKQIDLSENQEEKFDFNIDKLNESISELRNVSHSMASESLLKYGLENSLRDYCSNISIPGHFNISTEFLQTDGILLTEEQTFHIFRIVQELLQNTIKHSSATEAIVQLTYNNEKLYITVEDNGQGFSVGNIQRKMGMGLKNIENRVKILKGKMNYNSTPNVGTSALLEIPCRTKE